MSKAGYTYDNAPMERYFNTLKTDLIISIVIILKKSFMLLLRNLLMFIITMPDRMCIINIKCITRNVMGLNNHITILVM